MRRRDVDRKNNVERADFLIKKIGIGQLKDMMSWSMDECERVKCLLAVVVQVWFMLFVPILYTVIVNFP